MNTLEIPLPDLGWSAFFQSQIEIEEFNTLVPMRVAQAHRNAIDTIDPRGTNRFPITGSLAEKGVAVGDWIVADASRDKIIRVLDRKSVLKRGTAGDIPSAQLIAANVDTLFIVSSCNADFNVARLERYLALAHQAQIDPVVILTKSDLCADPADFGARARHAFRNVLVETVVATDPDVIQQLEPWCGRGQTVALLGSSGVGKTTLINALTGAQEDTQDIREDDSKGRHTTTRRALFRARSGGWVIDTPGMRSLSLTDVAGGVEMVFSDVSQLAESCRFNDCAHNTEPGCAVQDAIAAGDLDESRLARWQKLQREDMYNTRNVAQNRQHARKQNKKYAGGRARLKAKKGDLC